MLIRDNEVPEQRRQIAHLLSAEESLRVSVMHAKCPAKGLFVKSWFMCMLIARCVMALRTSEAFVFGDMRSPVFNAVSRLVGPRHRAGKLQYYALDDGMYLYPFLKARAGDSRYLSITYVTNLPITRLGEYKVVLPDAIEQYQKSTGDGAVFIGSRLVESEICALDDYLRELESTYRHLKQQRVSRVLYVAHRGESESNLRLYEKIGYSILRLDLPIEEYEARRGLLGRQYYSFYSSALFNLATRRVDETTYVALDPPPRFWKRNADQIACVYEMFRNSGLIQMQDLSGASE